MNQISFNSLEAIGLDKNKAKVYLVCLELGEAKAVDIARKAELKRTAVYDILDKLEQRGLVSSLKKRGGYFFIASNPKVIEQLLERQQQEVCSVLPDLETLYQSASNFKPRIRFFEGAEGIKTIVNESLLCKERIIRTFQVPPIIVEEEKKDRRFFEEYSRKRVQQRIQERCLREFSVLKNKEQYDELFTAEEKYLRSVKFLPSDFRINAPLVIWDNNVIVASFNKEEHYLFVVESKGFSEMMKTIFDVLWEILKTEKELLVHP